MYVFDYKDYISIAQSRNLSLFQDGTFLTYFAIISICKFEREYIPLLKVLLQNIVAICQH